MNPKKLESPQGVHVGREKHRESEVWWYRGKKLVFHKEMHHTSHHTTCRRRYWNYVGVSDRRDHTLTKIAFTLQPAPKS